MPRVSKRTSSPYQPTTGASIMPGALGNISGASGKPGTPSSSAVLRSTPPNQPQGMRP